MDPIIWSVLLLLLGLALLCAEIFIPSGGILGFLSILALLTGLFLAFFHRGTEVGLLFLIGTILAVPGVLMLAFRYWPHTPMGRLLLLEVPRGEEVLPDSPQRQKLRRLVGKFGVAKSVMMPSGAVLVEGETIDALSEGISIELGQPIEVIEVRGSRVLVRPVDESARPVAADDVLSQPIESLGLDALDDPLG